MRIIFLCLIFQFAIIGRSQDTILIAEVNHRKIEVFANQNPDEMRKFNSWAGFGIGADRWSFGGFSIYNPKKHYANFHFGTGAGYEGIIFFNHKTKKKNGTNSIYIGDNSTYSLMHSYKKRISHGLHYGGGYYAQYEYSRLWAANAFLGLSIFKGSSATWKIPELKQTRRGSTWFTYNLDVMHYFYVESDNYNPYGVRAYIEGNTAFWSAKGIFGYRYLIGLGTPAHKNDLIAMVGLGISFSFF